MSVTREKLYEEVWAEPMTKVAGRHGVSSSFLARVCKDLNVPRPPRGYWAQLEVGKAPAPPALPEPRPGDEIEWAREGEPQRVPRALPKAPEANRRKRSRSRADRPSHHRLVAGVRELFESSRESTNGYLKPSKKLLVDVFVSKGTLSRALDVANTLFLLLEDRGHNVVFAPRDGFYQRPAVDERERPGRQAYDSSWYPWRPTVVFVGTVAIGLTIFELSEEVEMLLVKGEYVPVSQVPVTRRRKYSPEYSWTTKRDMPSGRLCLRAFSPYPRTVWEREWRESKAGELPRKFRGVARELEREAATIAKLVEEAERQAELERQQWEAQKQRWLREEAERRRAEAIKASREQLFAVIEAWTLAKRIEGFFEDAGLRAAKLDDEEHAVVVERLKRARDLLGGIDALQRFRSWKTPEER